MSMKLDHVYEALTHTKYSINIIYYLHHILADSFNYHFLSTYYVLSPGDTSH